MNYYPKAIEIITDSSGFTNKALLIEVAKHNPCAIVRANEAILKRKNKSSWIEKVRPVVANGRKIEAIKLCRELTGLGLKEAKGAVEREFY